MLKLLNVEKRYDNGVSALKNVTLTVEQGEFVYLVGHSGAGKSTLIKLMYRELVPTSGFIQINNFDLRQMKERQVPQLRRTLGVVFQDFKLLPKMTVGENIGYALQVIGKSDSEIKEAVEQVLNDVGLEKQADHFPNELSGGQQQRVAIARAIVNRPKILIADEPTGNLDPQTTEGIMDILQRINNRGTTIIMATHNQQIVDELPHRVIEISAGQIIRDEQGGQYTHELDNNQTTSTR